MSGPNRSTAVMQRRSEPHGSLDDFPTPPWATRALCEFLRQQRSEPLDMFRCREPAANRGHMVAPLKEYFGEVLGSDVHDYGAGFPVSDYLFGPEPEEVDWTITNPPFRLAGEFIARALATSRLGVAVLVRVAFLEGETRYRTLFAEHPPSFVLQFCERVVILRGRLVRSGAPDPSEDDPNKKASTATAYAWLIWQRGERDTRLRWIAPCRVRLERDGDYPAAPEADSGSCGLPLLAGAEGGSFNLMGGHDGRGQ